MGTHTVNFSIEIGDQKWHEAKDKLPKGIYQERETRREIAIMQEVMNSKGKNIDEKIDNTLANWHNSKEVVYQKRYRLKYKY